MKAWVLACVLAVSLMPVAMADVHGVHKIFIGSMGSTDESERFRMMLSQRLMDKGVDIVEDKTAADAVLTGVVTVRTHDDFSSSVAYVQLRDPNNKVLWSKDFQKHSNQGTKKDPVSIRVDEVTKALRKTLD